MFVLLTVYRVFLSILGLDFTERQTVRQTHRKFTKHNAKLKYGSIRS